MGFGGHAKKKIKWLFAGELVKKSGKIAGEPILEGGLPKTCSF